MPTDIVSIHPRALIGKFRPLHGVNNGPYTWDGLMDLAAPYREAAFPDVRLHDVHYPARDVVDINTIFPDFARDPADPGAYEFRRTDHYLQTIVDCGSSITYRLGYAIDHHPTKLYPFPPRDFQKWAGICLGIARHYNEGWAGGFQNRVGRWEIWNEPNLFSGPHRTSREPSTTWQGTWAQYFELYAATARALKSHNPLWQIGGPAMSGIHDGFLEEFAGACATQQLPLDFCSWHIYHHDPQQVVSDARRVRQVLDENGFKGAQSLLTEWHYMPLGADWKIIMTGVPSAMKQQLADDMSGHRAAAFTLATILQLQDAPLDMAHFYNGDTMPYFGLFDSVGGALKCYHALGVFSRLLTTPNRLGIDGQARPGLTTAAGVNGSSDRLTFVAVNDTESYRSARILWGEEPLGHFAERGQIISSTHTLAAWPIDPDGSCILPPHSILMVETPV